MARPAPNLHAAADLGQRAVSARDRWIAAHGPISDNRMAARILQTTGVYTTHATLRKLWGGEMDPNVVMIDTILAIARFLEVDPDEFGPVIAKRRQQVIALANGEAEPLAASGAGAGGLSHASIRPAEIEPGLRCGHEPSGRVPRCLAGVVQRQNISFPNWYSGEMTQRQQPLRSVIPPFGR